MSSFAFSENHRLEDNVWDRFVRNGDKVKNHYMEIPKYDSIDSEDAIINQEPFWNSREIYRQMLASTMSQNYQPAKWTPLWPVKTRSKPTLISPSMVMDLPNISTSFYGCNNMVDWSVTNYLTVGFPRSIYLWDSVTHQTLKVRHKNTSCLKWSVNGTELFMASRNGSYRYTDIKVQEDLTYATQASCHLDCYLTSCTFHPRCPIMYVGCCMGVVTAFCVNKGLHIILKIQGNNNCGSGITSCAITSLTLSKGGEYLAVNSMTNEILVIETINLTVLFTIPMTGPSRVVAWHPWKVNLLVVADCHSYMALYDVLDPWEPVATYFPEFDSSILSAVFSPITAELVISQTIFSSRRGNHGQRHNPLSDPSQVSVLASFDRIADKLEGHQGAVQLLCWSPDGTQLGTFGVDETTRIWDFLPDNLKERAKKTKSKNYGSASLEVGKRMGFAIR